MIPLMAPLLLVDGGELATGKTLTELNSLVRLAHTLERDGTLKKPIFVINCVMLLGQIVEP